MTPTCLGRPAQRSEQSKLPLGDRRVRSNGAAIWRHNLPDKAPTDGIDVEWLAENFELSGGAIRNAAIQAGFVSAAAGTDVSMEAAVSGVARELRKMGRLLKPSDFGEYHAMVSD